MPTDTQGTGDTERRGRGYVSPKLAARVRAAFEHHGEARVLAALGLDPVTASRVAAELPTQQGSLALTEARLAQLDPPVPAPRRKRGAA